MLTQFHRGGTTSAALMIDLLSVMGACFFHNLHLLDVVKEESSSHPGSDPLPSPCSSLPLSPPSFSRFLITGMEYGALRIVLRLGPTGAQNNKDGEALRQAAPDRVSGIFARGLLPGGRGGPFLEEGPEGAL